MKILLLMSPVREEDLSGREFLKREEGIMTTWFAQAKEKLSAQFKTVNGAKEGAMKSAVRDALLSFAEQNEEFAQAIVQGGSFADCMKAVAKGVGRSISDIEAYRKAVTFYFDGATVRFEMRIQLEPVEEDAAKTAAESGCILLSLDDFM